MARNTSQKPYGGNFTWRDEFDSRTLNGDWLQVRVPKSAWIDLRAKPGALTINALPEPLGTLGNPSFLGRRQQHLSFDASAGLTLPGSGRVAAGLAAFQNEKFWYFLGTRRTATGAEIFLERQKGDDVETLGRMAVSRPPQRLRVSANGRTYTFSYDMDGKGWQTLRENEDGTLLSTATAGGFVGVILGPYARAE
jgi:alpha-N-arabinofuranosidase